MRISTRILSFLLAGSALLNVGAGLYFFIRTPSRPAEPPVRQDQIKKTAKVLRKAPASPRTISLSMLHLDPLPARLKIRRSAILNTLADKYGYQAYLEIGQGQREQNLDWIQCRIRVGVDPEPKLNAAFQMTSDDFFTLNNDTFDLVFVDGLHHSGQVERDILNALAILNDNGSIVVHDCNPLAEEYQRVPRPKKPKSWTGDVWKAWVKFRASRPDLTMFVIDVDFGCGVIRRGSQETIKIPDPLTYSQLASHRAEWLNLVSVQDFLARLRD